MERRKEFLIHSFNDGATFTSEIIHPIGAQTSREITGGVRGKRKFRSFGIDKVARYFNGYDRSPIVRVIRQDQQSSAYGVQILEIGKSWQRLKLFGKDWFFVGKVEQMSWGLGLHAFLADHFADISGVALQCKDLRPMYPKSGLDVLRKRLELLAKRGWVRFDSVEAQADFDSFMYDGMPMPPREFYRQLE